MGLIGPTGPEYSINIGDGTPGSITRFKYSACTVEAAELSPLDGFRLSLRTTCGFEYFQYSTGKPVFPAIADRDADLFTFYTTLGVIGTDLFTTESIYGAPRHARSSWVKPNGHVGTRGINVGKYPTVLGILRELADIAGACPQLDTTFHFFSDDMYCEDFSTNCSMMTVRVKGGKVYSSEAATAPELFPVRPEDSDDTEDYESILQMADKVFVDTFTDAFPEALGYLGSP